MPVPTWADYDRLFFQLAAVLRTDWQAMPALIGSQASPTVEQACDEWSRRLARNMFEPLNPPDSVKPWLLARVLWAHTISKSQSEQPRAVPPEASPQTMEHFLIAEWHGAGRIYWSGSQ